MKRAPVAQWQSAGIVSRGPVVRLHPGRSIFLAAAFTLALLSAYMAQPAYAEDQGGQFSSEGLTGSGVVATDEGTHTPSFFAREEARYRRGRFQLAAQLTGQSEKAGVSLEDQATVESVEGFLLVSERVVPGGALAGVVGITRASLGTPGPIRRTWLGGALLGTRDRYLLVGVGEREVVAPGLLAMAAFRAHLREKVGVCGDVAGRYVDGRLKYQARAYAYATVWGTR